MKSTNIYLKNKTQRAKAKAEFSLRLNNILIEKGKRSTRSLQGSDPKFLSKIAGCSIVMARRYLLGQSIPSETNLKKIASWANVDPNWLLYGNKKIEATKETILIDKNILTEILISLRPYLSNTKLDGATFKNYISFAADIYENISHLDVSIEDKVKMIQLMVRSIDLAQERNEKIIQN